MCFPLSSQSFLVVRKERPLWFIHLVSRTVEHPDIHLTDTVHVLGHDNSLRPLYFGWHINASLIALALNSVLRGSQVAAVREAKIVPPTTTRAALLLFTTYF